MSWVNFLFLTCTKILGKDKYYISYLVFTVFKVKKIEIVLSTYIYSSFNWIFFTDIERMFNV